MGDYYSYSHGQEHPRRPDSRAPSLADRDHSSLSSQRYRAEDTSGYQPQQAYTISSDFDRPGPLSYPPAAAVQEWQRQLHLPPSFVGSQASQAWSATDLSSEPRSRSVAADPADGSSSQLLSRSQPFQQSNPLTDDLDSSDEDKTAKKGNLNWDKYPWLLEALAHALVSERNNGTKNNDGSVTESQYKEIAIELRKQAVARGTPLPRLSWSRIRGKVQDINRNYYGPLKILKGKSGWGWDDKECKPLASDELWEQFLANKVSQHRTMSYDIVFSLTSFRRLDRNQKNVRNSSDSGRKVGRYSSSGMSFETGEEPLVRMCCLQADVQSNDKQAKRRTNSTTTISTFLAHRPHRPANVLEIRPRPRVSLVGGSAEKSSLLRIHPTPLLNSSSCFAPTSHFLLARRPPSSFRKTV